MSAAKEKLAALRAVLTAVEAPDIRVPLGVARLDAALAGGLKRGGLHEVVAVASHEAAATGFVAALAVRLGGPVLWVRQDYAGQEHGELAATGLFELGLDPGRLILLRVPDAVGALKAACDALSCPALGAVVIELVGTPKLLDLVAYRKLALAAGQSGVTVLLLRFSADPAIGVPETRWAIRAAPSAGEEMWGRPVFAADLQRNRHGVEGHWVVEWSCDDGVFRPADCGVVVCPSADRPAASAMVA
jgi:protein ImuA